MTDHRSSRLIRGVQAPSRAFGLVGCQVAALLALLPAVAEAQSAHYPTCFFRAAEFGCYIDADGYCSEATDGAVRGFPSVQLEEDPFVAVADPRWRGWSYGLVEENPDADADGLWDESELEIASRFRL